jgi:hypothetical protein
MTQKTLEISTRTNLDQFLQAVLCDHQTHSLWLNTLSLLEHIGSRKILLTQSSEETSEMILRHATEEARHALFFKKAAGSISKNLDTGYRKNEILQGSSARVYFAKLDASVLRNLKKSKLQPSKLSYLAYLFTTTIIEKRAMIVYEMYDELLANRGESFSLRNLILEEEGHLDEMQTEIMRLDPEYRERLDELMNQEEKLFTRFLQKLQLSLAS